MRKQSFVPKANKNLSIKSRPMAKRKKGRQNANYRSLKKLEEKQKKDVFFVVIDFKIF